MEETYSIQMRALGDALKEVSTLTPYGLHLYSPQ